MHYEFTPRGVCARSISFDLEGATVRNVRFTGGCPGNLEALRRAVDGMSVQQLVRLFSGIDCGGKGTSCSDQLARLVQRAHEESA